MKKKMQRILSALLACFLLAGYAGPVAHASDTAEDPVQAVIAQLEAIDSLATMQSNRSKYTASGHYDTGTTNESVITAHETARANYENYVANMFAARIAAQEAYDALSASQKSQIDPALVAKLTDKLETKFNSGTYAVTPPDDEYSFDSRKNHKEACVRSPDC